MSNHLNNWWQLVENLEPGQAGVPGDWVAGHAPPPGWEPNAQVAEVELVQVPQIVQLADEESESVDEEAEQ